MTEDGNPHSEALDAWLGGLGLLHVVDDFIAILASSQRASDPTIRGDLADALVGAASFSRTIRALTTLAVEGIERRAPPPAEDGPAVWGRAHLR